MVGIAKPRPLSQRKEVVMDFLCEMALHALVYVIKSIFLSG
jgi:hypothetical protein